MKTVAAVVAAAVPDDRLAAMPPAPSPCAFPYAGPETLRQPLVDALSRVVDPEVALSIVDVGLIYGVTVTPETLEVRMTMTSAACPVAGLMVEEVEAELAPLLQPGQRMAVVLTWEPPWSPDRMSAHSRRFMGW